MPSVRYVAMYGDLQISPHPRRTHLEAAEDADKWQHDQQRQGRIVKATVEEMEHGKNLKA